MDFLAACINNVVNFLVFNLLRDNDKVIFIQGQEFLPWLFLKIQSLSSRLELLSADPQIGIPYLHRQVRRKIVH
jgi:hypothetical protein